MIKIGPVSSKGKSNKGFKHEVYAYRIKCHLKYHENGDIKLIFDQLLFKISKTNEVNIFSIVLTLNI